MNLTDAQRELLEDKFVLWDRASREGNMELRDYNRRAAEALKVALSIVSAALSPPSTGGEGEAVAWRCLNVHGDAFLTEDANGAHFWLKSGKPVQPLYLHPSPEMGEISRERAFELISAAYSDGCQAVHDNYQPDPDPEFGEGRQHLAFGDQFPDRPGDVFDGYERVDPMLVEQVDES